MRNKKKHQKRNKMEMVLRLVTVNKNLCFIILEISL